MKITEVLAARMSFSFEVFPPKTDAGMANLKEALPHFLRVRPRFHQLYIRRWREQRGPQC